MLTAVPTSDADPSTTPTRRSPRHSRWRWLLAAAYVPTAVVLALVVPAGHPLLIWPALAAVVTLVLQRVIRLPLAEGHASIVQPALVILLFALPLELVAIVVPACLFLSGLLQQRRLSVHGVVPSLAGAWFCVPVVVVLAAWAPGQFDWSHWLVYLIALVAEVTVILIGTVLRRDRQHASGIGVLVMPAAVDLLLTPLGAAAAHAGALAPEQSILILFSVVTLMTLLRRERIARISYERRALRDELTGLANRALFDEMLDASSRRQARSGDVGGLLFIDLDNFKAVNDTHGHLAGDAVLRETAERIGAVVRDADTVARFGGDEFAVLLADMQSRGAVERVAKEISEVMAEPIRLEPDLAVTVSASIGLAYLGAETEPADAVAHADEAMYEAKQVAHARTDER